jgi:hypothetical protein
MSESHHAGDDLRQLAAAPRPVPARLCLHLLTEVALPASVMLCLIWLFCLPSLVHLSVLSTWRLGQRREEVQGTLLGCGRQTDLFIFSFRSYQYTFRTPDGTVRTGVSYGPLPPEMEAAGTLERGVPAGFRVPVEYHPEHPEASRIRGTGAGLVAFQTLWPVPFLGLLLAIACGQLWEGARKIRLLRRGIPVLARITACTYYLSTDDHRGQVLPIEEYRSRWRAAHAHDPTIADVMEGVACTFRFVLPGGQEVEARDTTPLDSRPGVPLPLLLALYDPACPRNARFLHNLGPALRVSSAGTWEAGVGWLAPCLRSLLVFGFLLAPACVWVWWDWQS